MIVLLETLIDHGNDHGNEAKDTIYETKEIILADKEYFRYETVI